MYNTFSKHQFDQEERFNDLIAFLTDFLTRHPWFEMVGEVQRFAEPKIFHHLSCYEEYSSISADTVIFVRPTRRAPTIIGVHAFLISKADGVKCNFARLPDVQTDHVYETEPIEVLFSYPQYYLIRACFSMYDSLLNVVQTSRNYRETKSNYRKALDKAFDRFGPPVRREREFIQPEFYPIGTIVKLKASISRDMSEIQTVLAVSSNAPNSYILRLDSRYESSTFTHDPQMSINTAHVERIIKRGSGRTLSGDEVLQNHMDQIHRAGKLYYGELPSVNVYRRAEVEMMKSIESITSSHWFVHQPAQFVTKYIEALCNYSMDFYCQFDVHRFLSSVTEVNESWYEPYKINKKRFRKQLRRLHCFLNKKKIAVEEDRIEDLRYCEEIY